MKTKFTTAKGTELPLSNIKGKEYLNVAYRLVWFREEQPEWGIQTIVVQSLPDQATMKAIVTDEKDRIIATSHKTEDRKGFADFLEKAETGAIGRALALCGYGTQFTDDLEEENRIVDAPTDPVKKSLASRSPEELSLLEKMTQTFHASELTVDDMKTYLVEHFSKTDSKTLTKTEMIQATKWLESLGERVEGL